MRARLPASVAFLAALLLALNVVCLCPHAAAAAERSAAAPAVAADHCAGGHEAPNAPGSDEPRCPHCDEVGARLAQSGTERGLGTPVATIDLAFAPFHAPLPAAPERAATLPALRGGVAPPAAFLRTIVLQI